MRKAADPDEELLYLQFMGQSFLDLSRGNPDCHYTYDSIKHKYEAVDRGITLDDVVRHLRGVEPGLLSIPIKPADADGKSLTHFGVIDADRHFEADTPIDHAELARSVKMLGLPLIVCRSKNPKSAHLLVFWKDKSGFSCALTQQILEKWTRILAITGETEIFPKQTELKMVKEEGSETEEMQRGNGVNLPYFGSGRTALGDDGQELSLMEFLVLAAQRRVFGVSVARRELGDEQSEPRESGPKDRKYGPMTIETIRSIHAKNLQNLHESNQAGHWNDTANITAYFAAMAFAANALEGTEKQIKDEMLKAANPANGVEEKT
jgi:hypothetical protein